MLAISLYKPELYVLGSVRKFLIAFFFLASSFNALSTQISVAGFAFAGDFSSAAERFPYTYKIFQNQKATGEIKNTFTYFVTEKSKAVKNSEIEFIPGGMVNLKSHQGLMTVLMLTGETISVENFGSYYKTFVNLRGDALVFDYMSQTIVRSCPVSVVLFDATTEKPDEERIAGFVNHLIRRDDARGLVTQFTRCLDRTTLPKDGVMTVQVRKGEVSSEALLSMPEALRKNPDAVNAMFSDALASILSAKLGISMLPTNIGHAVGGVMSMRLENGDDYKLKLGEGDFVIDVKLNKLAKIKTSETNVGVAFVYGAYVSLRLSEPTLNTAYIDTDLKNGESAVIPVGQINGDDFSGYQDAIRGVFLKLADAIQKPESKWIVLAASAKNIESQMESARVTLRKCK